MSQSAHWTGVPWLHRAFAPTLDLASSTANVGRSSSPAVIWYNMAMEQRDDIFDFGMMNAEDSLIDEVNPDWRDFADGGDELFWRCGCETDFVHPESLSVCPICGRERDI